MDYHIHLTFMRYPPNSVNFSWLTASFLGQRSKWESSSHNWATCFHFSFSCIREGNGNPLQCSCLENPRDGGAVYGVAQSQTWLKQLSSSSTMSWDHSCASPRDLGEGCYVIKVLGKYMGTSYRELLTLSYLSQWLSVNFPYASSVNGLATETL